MKKGKRILSLLLVFVLVLSLLPMSAFAAGTPSGAIGMAWDTSGNMTLTTVRKVAPEGTIPAIYEGRESGKYISTATLSAGTVGDGNIAYCFSHGQSNNGGKPYTVTVSKGSKNSVTSDPEVNKWINAIMAYGYPARSKDEIVSGFENSVNKAPNLSADQKTTLISLFNAERVNITDAWVELATQLAIWYASNQIYIAGLNAPYNDFMETYRGHEEEHEWEKGVYGDTTIPIIYAMGTRNGSQAQAVLALAASILEDSYYNKNAFSNEGTTKVVATFGDVNAALLANANRMDLTGGQYGLVKFDYPEGSSKAGQSYVVTEGTPHSIYNSPSITGNKNVYRQWLRLEHRDDLDTPREYSTSDVYYAMYFAMVSDAEPTSTNIDVSGFNSDAMKKFNGSGSGEHAILAFIDPEPSKHAGEYGVAATYDGYLNYMAEEIFNPTGAVENNAKYEGGKIKDPEAAHIPSELLVWSDNNDSDSPRGNQLKVFWKQMTPAEANRLNLGISTDGWPATGKWVAVGKVLTPAWAQDHDRLKTDFDKSERGGAKNNTSGYQWDTCPQGKPETNLTITATIHTRQPAVYRGNGGDYQDIIFWGVEEADANTNVQFHWDGINFDYDRPNYAPKEIRVQKVDSSTNTPLAGATFTCSSSECENGSITRTTGLNGIATFEVPDTCRQQDGVDKEGNPKYAMKPCKHTWTITEVSAPAGYIPSAIPGNGQSNSFRADQIPEEGITLEWPNAHEPDPDTLTIRKVDADTGRVVPGAWFQVKNIDTGTTYRFLAANGTVSLHNDRNRSNDPYYIPNGSYVVTEYIAPDGYQIDTGFQTFNFNEYGSGSTNQLVFRDYKEPSIRITKLDANSRRTISGVTFDYWFNGTYKGETQPTNNMGYVTLKNLSTGTYTFREKSVPSNYIKSDKEYTVHVDCARSNPEKTYYITVENYLKKSIVITKEDAETGLKLSGARFNIRGMGNSFTTTVETDTTGTARVEGLSYGTYQITETRAPAGYEISEEPFTLVIDEDSTDDIIYLPAFQDNPMAGLMIQKIDSTTKQAIPNVGFKVEYLGEGGTQVENHITDTNGLIILPDTKAGWYRITETTTPAGYVKNSEPQMVQVTNTHEPVTVTFENDQTGLLNILKLETNTGLPLAGARFEIRTAGGDLIDTVTTGGNGYATYSGLTPGSYVVREIEAPDRHVIDPYPQSFEVKAGDAGKTYLLVFHNTDMGSLYIRKVDANTNQAVAGAVFKVTDSEGKVIAERVVTGEDGLALVDRLETGTYIVTEIKAPDGYLLDATPQTVMLYAGQTKTLTFRDNKPGGIAIKKVDAATAAVLPGAVFELYDLDDHKLGGNYTTGEDGIVRIGDLEPGYYYIKEVQAPDGYQCDGRPIRVKVEAFLMTEVTVTNTQKSSLTIEKRDKETNVLLEGATFKVTRRDGSVIAENLVTGKSGTVTINGLAKGDYYVTETKAPAGYLLNTEAQLVAVKGDEASIVTFYNQLKKNMVIRKVDSSTNIPLAGATFDLYHLNGALVGTYTTDTSGTITTQALEPGFYTLKETHAPDGYEAGWIPNATTGSATAGGSKVTQQTIEIPAGETVTVTIPNTPLPVIEIQKADSVTSKPLMGAQFTVANEQGNVIGTYTTGTAGNVFTEKLPSGWYKVTEVKAPTGYILNDEPMRVKLTAGVPTVARFVNDPKTSLLITKIDDATSKPLTHATFELRTLEGEKVGEYTTGANGTVTIASVAPGKYQLVEVDAPDGYMLDSTAHNVTVNAGVVNSITIRNKAFPTLTVFKGDSTGKPLPGATIKLETADGDFVAQGVTDSAGEIIFTGIKPGHYIVTETKAPTGYEMVSDPVVTTVKYGVNNRVELVNAQWGGLLIKLTDQKDGKPLANGQFTVTHCADNAIVYTGTTDTAGTILVGNLIPGDKYIVTQTMAPDGYTIVDKEKSEFVVAGENRLVLFEDTTAGIVIEKVDALTGKTLAGARFQLTRNSDNIVIGEYVTGTDGLALASGLTPGMYTVEELVAPKNYTIDEGPKLVHVKANTTAHVTFKDTPFAGITIKSIDSVTNKPIAGTVFEVYEQNGELVNSYTTDSTGTVETGVLTPGHYVIKQTYVKDGYEPKDTERTVEIKDGKHVTETFYSVPAGTLNMYAVDNSYKGLSGMRVTITKINGELVANGLTDSTGVFTVTGLAPGYYVVTETKAPNGYLIGTASKNILVMAGKPANVYFTHDKTYGVQILTTVKQTQLPLAGVQYQVTKSNGEIIKTYTSDEAGYIYVPLDPGDYVVTPVSVPDGYAITDSQKITVVKANKYATVNFVATQLSSIRVQLVDGQTKQGIYGVRLLVKDSTGNIVGECWTNNEGKIVLSKELPDGTYILEQITVPDGYAMDKIPKTVQILNGQTTEVVWTLWKVAGQIQVELRSSDYNSILDKAQNSLLYGGMFEVIDPVSYQVVATMTTDAYGVAATKGLPLGRYLVRQLSAPAYYANSTQVSEVTLKVANDVVRVNFYDPSLALTVAVDHKSNNNVAAGQVMRVDVLEVSNNSNTALSNAYWTIKVPTDCARIGTFYTGSWNQAVWYSASYKTNMTDYRDLAKNLNSTTNNQFDLSSTALGLQNGEYVTEVRLEFGTVPANWKLVSQPAFMLYILPGVYDTYKVITRMEYGGKYLDAWVSNTSLWTTNVLNPGNKSGVLILDPYAKFPSALPKTGY